MMIGEKIRELRIKKDMTQKELGELCGINEANIRKYESGRQNPKIETLNKIAKALEISTAQLMGWEEIVQQREASGISTENIAEEFDIPLEILIQWEKSPALVPTGFVAKYQKAFQMLEQIKNKNNLIAAFDKLNDTGQKKAVEHIEDLSKIPDYQKKPDEE